MGRKIAIWIVIGAAVAGVWVLIALAAGPSINFGRSAVVAITAPASLLGRRMPMTFYWFIVLNGAFYGVVGGAIALLARQFRPSLPPATPRAGI